MSTVGLPITVTPQGVSIFITFGFPPGESFWWAGTGVEIDMEWEWEVAVERKGGGGVRITSLIALKSDLSSVVDVDVVCGKKGGVERDE